VTRDDDDALCVVMLSYVSTTIERREERGEEASTAL
jgi:hypothetical protein